MKKENTSKVLAGSGKGDIVEINPNMFDVKKYSDIFAPYKFTTEDGVDAYVGDTTYFISANVFSEHTVTERGHYLYAKHYSTREAAQAYLDEQNKPKFEVGKVYKDPSSNRMFMITDFKDIYNVNAYGFGGSGHWYNDNGKFEWSCENVAEATPAEWESALLKEAERRYPLKTNYISANLINGKCSVVDKFKFLKENKISDGWGGYVFYDGKWAEIVPSKEQPKEKTNYYYFNEWKKDITSPGFIDWLNSKSLIITPKPCNS